MIWKVDLTGHHCHVSFSRNIFNSSKRPLWYERKYFTLCWRIASWRIAESFWQNCSPISMSLNFRSMKSLVWKIKMLIYRLTTLRTWINASNLKCDISFSRINIFIFCWISCHKRLEPLSIFCKRNSWVGSGVSLFAATINEIISKIVQICVFTFSGWWVFFMPKPN